MSAVTGIISAIAANRKAFFDLVAAAEQLGSCEIDDIVLQAEIDSSYSDRTQVSDAEAHAILMKVSHPKAMNDAGGVVTSALKVVG